MLWYCCHYGVVATFLKRKKCRTFITWTNLGAGGKRKLYKINGHWPLRVGEGQAKSVKDCTKTLLLIFHCWYLCSFTERKIIFRYKNLLHIRKKPFSFCQIFCYILLIRLCYLFHIFILLLFPTCYFLSSFVLRFKFLLSGHNVVNILTLG